MLKNVSRQSCLWWSKCLYGICPADRMKLQWRYWKQYWKGDPQTMAESNGRTEPYLATWLHNQGGQKGLPIGGNFELTPRCNFRCPMCYVHMDPAEAEKVGKDRGREGIMLEVPLSRADLAGLARSTPESVSRVMSRWKREGLVDSGRRWTALLDVRRLEAERAGSS